MDGTARLTARPTKRTILSLLRDKPITESSKAYRNARATTYTVQEDTASEKQQHALPNKQGHFLLRLHHQDVVVGAGSRAAMAVQPAQAITPCRKTPQARDNNTPAIPILILLLMPAVGRHAGGSRVLLIIDVVVGAFSREADKFGGADVENESLPGGSLETEVST